MLQVAEETAARGDMGPAAKGLRVVYAQTDSLFVHMPHATPEQVRLHAQNSGCSSGQTR